MKKLDDVQFGCMISRTAKLHPEGGTWTLSRALGEVSGSLEAIETKKTLAGKDFGELVRERRRQFGLPLPIADKVLPFRAGSAPESSERLPSELAYTSAEARVAEAWERLDEAERSGRSSRTLRALEAAYHEALVGLPVPANVSPSHEPMRWGPTAIECSTEPSKDSLAGEAPQEER